METGVGQPQWAGGLLTRVPCRPPPCQAVDPMRAAYLDDLRSKFLLENSVLKMEYADVRVLHLGHKVGTAHVPSWPALFLTSQLAGFDVHSLGFG